MTSRAVSAVRIPAVIAMLTVSLAEAGLPGPVTLLRTVTVKRDPA